MGDAESGDGVDLKALRAQLETMRQERDEWQRKAEFLRGAFDALPHPLYIVDIDTYQIRMANKATGGSTDPIGMHCHGLTHRLDVPCEEIGHPCPLADVKRTGKPVRVEHVHHDEHGHPCQVEVSAFPIFDDAGRLVEMLEFTIDISRRKEAEAARERVITELNAALAQVKTLSGLIPICASCKKVRDDRGYWNQLEEYIRARSDAEFSHSICPDCRDVFLSDLPSRQGS